MFKKIGQGYKTSFALHQTFSISQQTCVTKEKMFDISQ